MDKKIMICGASGTGKTTLAKHMSELYELPFVSTSAKDIWPEFEFKSHSDAHAQSTSNKSIGIAYQGRILRNRMHILEKHTHYITDRSFVDNAAYIMMELGHFLNPAEMNIYLDWCSEGMKDVDGLIYLPWSPQIILEDDKNRITNEHFQEMTDVLLNWVINESKINIPCPFLRLYMWDFETRIQFVDEWLKNL